MGVKKVFFPIFMILILIFLAGCKKTDTKLYEIPVELVFGTSSDSVSDEDIMFQQYRLKQYVKDGTCESATIKSNKIVVMECTDEQIKNMKENMLYTLNFNPLIIYPFGPKDITMSYSDDYTHLTLSLQEGTYNEYKDLMVTSLYVDALMHLQIFNGVPYNDVKVTQEIIFTDTDKREIKEYNCFNYVE